VAEIADNQYLRGMLANHYPGINIKGVAKTSGQRVVYFCTFSDFSIELPEGPELRTWSRWHDVVVKVSNTPSLESITRLSKEIELLTQLDSVFFPTLHHHELLTFDPSDEMPLEVKLLVTIEERIPSKPLSECMESFSEEKSAAKLLHSLISAMSGLWDHKQKYVHRDLKPDNILIRECGTPVIIDLGIVRETGVKGITQTQAPYGVCTVMYASFEQIFNDKLNINFKSDLFALGVITYQLVSGRHPFYSTPPTSYEEVKAVLTSYTPTPLKDIASVSEGFSKIVCKLLENHPYKRYRRYQTVLEQLADIGVT